MYIGQTKRPVRQRFLQHLSAAHNKSSGQYNTHIAHAIRKYGRDSFSYEIIDYAETEIEACEKEKYWIQELNTITNGYNINPGGFVCGGNTYAGISNLDEIRKKISESKIGANNPNSRSVLMTDLITGDRKLFGSMQEAANELDLSSHMPISRMCRGVKKSPIKNRYIFEYCNDKSVTTIENVAQ